MNHKNTGKFHVDAKHAHIHVRRELVNPEVKYCLAYVMLSH